MFHIHIYESYMHHIAYVSRFHIYAFMSPTGCAKKFYPLCRIMRYHQPNFYISPEF